MLLIAETPEAAVNYIRDSVSEILEKAGHKYISSLELEIECARLPSYKVIFGLEELAAPEDRDIYLIPGVEHHPNFNRYLLALKGLGLPARTLKVSDFYKVDPVEISVAAKTECVFETEETPAAPVKENPVDIEMERPPIEEKTNQGKKHGTNRS